MDFTKLRTWLLGLLGAVINSAATAGVLVLADPADFNPFMGGFRKLGTVMLVSALSGCFLYLKQNQLPIDATAASAPTAAMKGTV